MNPKLFLFDIDQTLISGAGCGRRALERAFEEIFHVPASLSRVTFNGKTDTSILQEMETLFRVRATEDKETLLWENYLLYLEEELKREPEAKTNPGVLQLLETLEADSNAHLGLLTGNIYEGARIKLEHFNLWRFFPVGGFGSDDFDRNRVAQIALERSSRHFKIPFEPNQVYVIGDSVRDITCGRAIGARPVVVATGMDSYETLAACKPYMLFTDFSDTVAVLSRLRDGTTSLARNKARRDVVP